MRTTSLGSTRKNETEIADVAALWREMGPSLMRFILTYLLATCIALLGVGCDFTVYLVCDPDYWPNGTLSEVQAIR